MQLSEDQLIAKHAPIVRRQALSIAARLPANIELDDLIQVGMIGLLDAVRRYEHYDSVKFENYAVTRIRGAILDELRSIDWLPRGARAKSKLIEEAIHSATQKLLRTPTEEEIAIEMGVSLKQYQNDLQETEGTQILMYEDLIELSDVDEITQTIAVDHGFNPMDFLAQHDLRLALIDAIKDLPEQEQVLLSLQFEQNLNQKEIAAVMDLTEGRVSQLRSQAVIRVRTWLKENDWGRGEVKPEYIENLF